MSQPGTEPVAESATEPVTVPEAQPVAESVAESVTEPVPEAQPVAEPVIQPATAEGLDSSPVNEKVRPKKIAPPDFPPDYESWSPCRQQSWLQLQDNPNGFFYRHLLPGEQRKNGAWSEEENLLFLQTLQEHPPETGHWGLFSRHIPGRVGYQCNAQYKRLIAAGRIPKSEESQEQKVSKVSTEEEDPPRFEGFADHEFADRYPLTEVTTLRFVPQRGPQVKSFREILKEFTQDPANQKLLSDCLTGRRNGKPN
jgi:hypothetical protein